MKKQSGFTLVELIVVIVILGILSAVALPRFINLTGDARFAAAQGMTGALRSAVALAQSTWVARGSADPTVDMNGTTVNVGATGIPTSGDATGIVAALQTTDGFTVAHTGTTTTTFTQTGAPATCVVTYTAATGAVVAPVLADCD